MNVMKHLKMNSGNLDRRRLTHHLVGDGNLDTVIHTPVDGFFQREVALLENVKIGQRLGTILAAASVELAQGYTARLIWTAWQSCFAASRV